MSSDALKAKRSAAKGSFSRVMNSLRNVLDKNAPIMTVQKRFENLREAFDNLSERHNESGGVGTFGSDTMCTFGKMLKFW